MSYERTWEENQIVKIYKWANGFTKIQRNKLQKILGNGWLVLSQEKYRNNETIIERYGKLFGRN